MIKWLDLGALFTPTEKTKLAGIEDSATADQTNTEIRNAVEAATDSNTFTDADHTKLNGVETGATTDQTGAEIKTAYEAEANAYTDTKDTKLAGIEPAADVTDNSNVLSSGAVMRLEGWVVYTDDANYITIGTIPANSFIIRSFFDVTEIFNDGGTDTIRIGDPADTNSIAVSTEISAGGLFALGAGVKIGYNSAELTIRARYDGSSSNATQGKGLAVVEYMKVTAQP